MPRGVVLSDSSKSTEERSGPHRWDLGYRERLRGWRPGVDISTWGQTPALPLPAALWAKPTLTFPQSVSTHASPRRGVTLGSEHLSVFICKVGVTTKFTSEDHWEDGASEYISARYL